MKIKDLGSTLSGDYMPMGYNFDGGRPTLLIPSTTILDLVLTSMTKMSPMMIVQSKQYLEEFQLTLNDLCKSLYITIKYTTLRKQFKTIPNSKQERPIILYQAVASRITDGFAWLMAFSTLCSKVYALPEYIPLISPLLQYCHHSIFQRLIALRECCGGFGYLQASGHPACIEKVGYRAATINPVNLPQTAVLLKRFHFYSSGQSIEDFFGKNLTLEMLDGYSGMFIIFITVCINMKKNRQQLGENIYSHEFMRQSAIQGMHSAETFSRVQDSRLSQFLAYLVTSYILEHSRFINWKYIQVSQQSLFEKVLQLKNRCLNNISPELPKLCQLLDLEHIRNIVVAENNEDDFYQRVMRVSRESYRNTPQFNQQVRRPIVEMLVENRARL